MKKWVLVAATYLLIGASRPVFATTGGPELIQLLGIHQKKQLIYFLRIYRDESDRPAQLYFLHPRTGAIIQEKSLYAGLRQNDPDIHGIAESRITELKSLMTPLSLQPADSLQLASQITKSDMLSVQDVGIHRWRVELELKTKGWFGKGSVICYHDSLVRAVSWVPIPQKEMALAIISYTGLPDEGGYEKQDLFVLKKIKE